MKNKRRKNWHGIILIKHWINTNGWGRRRRCHTWARMAWPNTLGIVGRRALTSIHLQKFLRSISVEAWNVDNCYNTLNVFDPFEGLMECQASKIFVMGRSMIPDEAQPLDINVLANSLGSQIDCSRSRLDDDAIKVLTANDRESQPYYLKLFNNAMRTQMPRIEFVQLADSIMLEVLNDARKVGGLGRWWLSSKISKPFVCFSFIKQMHARRCCAMRPRNRN